MHERLSDLIFAAADRDADATALRHDGRMLTYAALAGLVETAARGLLEFDLDRADRVGVYLEKRFETVAALFATAAAGCVFVPVNPLLKPRQVAYILKDCNVRVGTFRENRRQALEPDRGRGQTLRIDFAAVRDFMETRRRREAGTESG